MSDHNSPLLNIADRVSSVQQPSEYLYHYHTSDKIIALLSLLTSIGVTVATAASSPPHYCNKQDPLSFENLRIYNYALLSVTLTSGAHHIYSAFKNSYPSSCAPLSHCILGSLCIAMCASLAIFGSFVSTNCEDFKDEIKNTFNQLTYSVAATAILSGLSPLIAKFVYNNLNRDGHGILSRGDSFLEP